MIEDYHATAPYVTSPEYTVYPSLAAMSRIGDAIRRQEWERLKKEPFSPAHSIEEARFEQKDSGPNRINLAELLHSHGSPVISYLYDRVDADAAYSAAQFCIARARVKSKQTKFTGYVHIFVAHDIPLRGCSNNKVFCAVVKDAVARYLGEQHCLQSIKGASPFDDDDGVYVSDGQDNGFNAMLGFVPPYIDLVITYAPSTPDAVNERYIVLYDPAAMIACSPVKGASLVGRIAWDSILCYQHKENTARLLRDMSLSK